MRRLYSIKNTAGFYFRVEPMQQHLVAEVRPAILALMGAVAFLLLIACANVANLLLVRAATRGRELAVRAALGGGRWALVRQMLVEVFLLAAAGAVAGLVLASLGISLLISLGPRICRGSNPSPSIYPCWSSRPWRRFCRPRYLECCRRARVAAGHHGRAARQRADYRPGQRAPAAQRRGDDGSGAFLRPADRVGLMVRSFYAITQPIPGSAPKTF